MLALILATRSKIFRINAPAPENAVYQDHDGKNIAEFDRYVGQKTFVDEEVCAETDKENGHGSAQNDERGTQAAPVADAVVGRHKSKRWQVNRLLSNGNLVQYRMRRKPVNCKLKPVFSDAKFGRNGGLHRHYVEIKKRLPRKNGAAAFFQHINRLICNP